MPFYAQRGPEASEVGQNDMAERRRVDEIVKRIEQQQQAVMVNLQIWLRWRDQASPTADQAMARLIEARRQENQLWKNLFGIESKRHAIARQ